MILEGDALSLGKSASAENEVIELLQEKQQFHRELLSEQRVQQIEALVLEAEPTNIDRQQDLRSFIYRGLAPVVIGAMLDSLSESDHQVFVSFIQANPSPEEVVGWFSAEKVNKPAIDTVVAETLETTQQLLQGKISPEEAL